MSAPARDLMHRLDAAGVTLALDGDGNLRLKAAAPPPAALLAEAKRLKPELLTLLRSEAANGNENTVYICIQRHNPPLPIAKGNNETSIPPPLPAC